MRTNTNTIVAIATATLLPLFAFNATAADESAVTHAEAQQIRIAAISVETEMNALQQELKIEHDTEIVAMSQLNEEQMELEIDEDLSENAEYQELIAD